MDKIKKTIIVLLIFIIILIIFMILLIKPKVIEQNASSEQNVEEVLDKENIIQGIENNKQYFYVKACIDKYKQCASIVYNMTGLNEYQRNNSISQLKSLIPDFVEEKLKIDDNNISGKLGWPDCIVRIDNIYVSRQTINKNAYIEKTNINAYVVKGILINPNNIQNKKDFNLIVVIDEINSRFLIIPQEYITSEGINIQEGQPLKIYQEEAIDDFTYNGYMFENKSEMDMAKEYFNMTKYYNLYDTDYLYNKMTEEYRTKRFGNIENYRKYIKDNQNELQNSTIQKYLVNYNDDNIQYVIKDQYENLYIFDTKTILNYTVKLDTYTIEEEKFTTTYSQSNAEKKVQMNIDKFFQMINRQDYRTSYNCLAESFKSSRIKTQADFELIAKNRFFKYNTISFESFKELGSNTYSYLVKLKDFTGEKADEISMNVIMQLTDRTDFVMSFSFN